MESLRTITEDEKDRYYYTLAKKMTNRAFDVHHTFMGKVDKNGQITIPVEIREGHNINTGDQIILTYQQKSTFLSKKHFKEVMIEIPIISEKNLKNEEINKNGSTTS